MIVTKVWNLSQLSVTWSYDTEKNIEGFKTDNFLLLFSFIFLFLDLGLEVSVMSHICHMTHDTVTSHSHIISCYRRI